ncbi:unannotated protein [freshwater metagenome]|uniref:Unannotated protein n=1 Tax=freshwater metagenome TaxID=449393 RepID=A0A6J6MEM9_9ZZZZ|nr:DUF4389 domain-containing protein [Actinomycetota bacterium]
MSNQIETSFQVQLHNRNKTTVFWRLIIVAPVFIFAASFTVDSWDRNGNGNSLGLLVLPVMLALLFRGVYPSYVLSFNKALFGLTARIGAYITLLNDEYPSIEESASVTITYPEVNGGKSLHRGLPLIKWAMAIPLYIVGIVYCLYSLIMVVLAWFNIILTGEMPESCADVIVRTSQYWNRLYGYAILLVTDEYPTFSL